jgi:DNA-binding GntR family transcriptional regulator/transposase-like protein
MPTAAERHRWVQMLQDCGSVAQVCATFGISAPTLRKWRRRFEATGVAGLEEASRAPASSPHQKVFAAQEALIVGLRQTERLGVHRLRAALRDRHGFEVSADTILKVLRRAGEPPLRAGRPGPGTQVAVPATNANPPTQGSVAGGVAELITQGTLRPGEKLSEGALASRLGTGRTLVREALKQLAITGLVVLERHRGAFVAQPSMEQVQQTYAARRLIEGAIVREVAGQCTAHGIRRLRQHLDLQLAAHASGQRRVLVRLLTDFHLVLASLGENRVFEGILNDLTAKTSLAVMVYDHGGRPSCALEEHAMLIDLLAAGDGRGAAELMHRHLTTNLARLDPAAPAIISS